MFTLGAGGDSRILIDSRELKAGPQRVAPVGQLNGFDGHDDAVKFIEDLHADYCNSTAAMEILALTGREPDWKLSFDEEHIIEVLRQRPHSIKELAIKLKHGLWTLLNTTRLENAAVVQRYGLTPTDLLAASGRVALWPPDLSKRVGKLYQIIWGEEAGDFYNAVLDLIADNLLQTLVLLELDVAGSAADQVTESAAFKSLLRNLKGESRALRLSPTLVSGLVGVGAAAPFLLKRLAEHLGAELQIPEDGDVANAVGAVCSMVTVHREASVNPAADGSFIVNGFDNAPHFDTYEEACDYLEENIESAIKKDALKAGTEEQTVLWAAENRMTPTSDGNYIFLGRDYRVEITGLPA